MIIDLPDTTTSQISKTLVKIREEGGAVALGRVLTLIISTKLGEEEEAIEAANEDGFPPLPAHLSGPLAAGNYSVWLVDGDADLSYTLDLHTAAVPEPATWSLMIGGFGLVGARLRRRAHRAMPSAIC